MEFNKDLIFSILFSILIGIGIILIIFISTLFIIQNLAPYCASDEIVDCSVGDNYNPDVLSSLLNWAIPVFLVILAFGFMILVSKLSDLGCEK